MPAWKNPTALLKHVFAAALLAIPLAQAQGAAGRAPDLSVGAQYDTTHVYVDAADYDAFIKSFTATFDGKASPRVGANVAPVPSRTQFRYVWTPVGTLSTFAYETPIPYPLGQERTGYLVTDMDEALKAARVAGAEVVVEKFKDTIGTDAVIQWPGGVKMQLYWHFTKPAYAPLASVPDNRVYISADTADAFVRGFVQFAHGKVVSDDRQADGAELGRPGEVFRRIRIASGFGNMQVNVTDGHLPYPFGYETTGYAVRDLDATLSKAHAAGAKLLWGPYEAADRSTAIVRFPGGYVVEIHATKARAERALAPGRHAQAKR